MSVPSMSKRTDSTLIVTMCGSAAGVMAPDDSGYANEDRRDGAFDAGTELDGVGMADMVKACFVKTDMVVECYSGGKVRYRCEDVVLCRRDS